MRVRVGRPFPTEEMSMSAAPSTARAADFEVPAGFVAGLFGLGGRVAIVTGGGSGIGAAIAKGLAQAGAAIVVVDIADEGAAATAATIVEQGGRATTLHCDVTDRAAVEAMAARVVADHGHVDVLVNSAGTAFRCPAEDFPEERLDAILDLNIKGTYLPCQAVGRHMLERGSGSIVNLASIGGFAAFPHASAYVTSKGAVVQLTRAFAIEWISRGVRVNGIAPCRVDSPLSDELATQSSVTSDFIDGRMLREGMLLPRDLVGAALFLASDASGRVSGHTIAVDDGYLVA
jgi:NAD(P)-dependent dehydrogenase (short-subunit alcohol dehydrogenase family)